MINDVVTTGYSVRAPAGESVPVPFSRPETEAEAQAPAVEPEVVMPKLQDAVRKLNDYTQNLQRTLSFSIEESTGRTVIRVYDAETDELIRQIPPEDTLKLAEILAERNHGLFIKERA